MVDFEKMSDQEIGALGFQCILKAQELQGQVQEQNRLAGQCKAELDKRKAAASKPAAEED